MCISNLLLLIVLLFYNVTCHCLLWEGVHQSSQFGGPAWQANAVIPPVLFSAGTLLSMILAWQCWHRAAGV
jgi:hypothetical protein